MTVAILIKACLAAACHYVYVGEVVGYSACGIAGSIAIVEGKREGWDYTVVCTDPRRVAYYMGKDQA